MLSRLIKTKETRGKRERGPRRRVGCKEAEGEEGIRKGSGRVSRGRKRGVGVGGEGVVGGVVPAAEMEASAVVSKHDSTGILFPCPATVAILA